MRLMPLDVSAVLGHRSLCALLLVETTSTRGRLTWLFEANACRWSTCQHVPPPTRLLPLFFGLPSHTNPATYTLQLLISPTGCSQACLPWPALPSGGALHAPTCQPCAQGSPCRAVTYAGQQGQGSPEACRDKQPGCRAAGGAGGEAGGDALRSAAAARGVEAGGTGAWNGARERHDCKEARAGVLGGGLWRCGCKAVQQHDEPELEVRLSNSQVGVVSGCDAEVHLGFAVGRLCDASHR